MFVRVVLFQSLICGLWTLLMRGKKTTSTGTLSLHYPPTMNSLLQQSIKRISLNTTIHQQIRQATKKAGGSTKNGRDSAGRRLGIKVQHHNPISAGGIIVRQRGSKIRAGENVGMGKDHTLFAKITGFVQFSDHAVRKRKVVSVVAAI